MRVPIVIDVTAADIDAGRDFRVDEGDKHPLELAAERVWIRTGLHYQYSQTAGWRWWLGDVVLPDVGLAFLMNFAEWDAAGRPSESTPSPCKFFLAFREESDVQSSVL